MFGSQSGGDNEVCLYLPGFPPSPILPDFSALLSHPCLCSRELLIPGMVLYGSNICG